MDKFYITTTLPYVNADPHVGFALEIVQADVVARYQRLMGKNIFFNTGTDEHGLKIFRKAEEKGIPAQEYADVLSEKFRDLMAKLNISEHNFIRTTDENHIKAAQEFWRKCSANGDIYKKNYKIKYCVGCELEKTESELVEGKCPDHNTEPEIIEEENYFFRFSKYQDKLLELYKKSPNFVVPNSRFNEIKKFVEGGLEDFSISRLKSKMPWGVSVPDDDEHVMYVWFDALVNYVSALGYGSSDTSKLDEFWNSGFTLQVAGKDNLRQQSAMWQAMLMSAGLPNSKQVVIHGFITSGGKKMSKMLGNVIDPNEIVNEYGVDALRYYLLREVSPFEDGDFTKERFKEVYNANLANGLGNLVSRVMKMSSEYNANDYGVHDLSLKSDGSVLEDFRKYLNEFKFDRAMDLIWEHIADGDKKIQEKEPFKLIKENPEEAKTVVRNLVQRVFRISVMLEPFLPETSQKIKELIKQNKMPDQPLFLRK